jgi:hypothetical protein
MVPNHAIAIRIRPVMITPLSGTACFGLTWLKNTGRSFRRAMANTIQLIPSSWLNRTPSIAHRSPNCNHSPRCTVGEGTGSCLNRRDAFRHRHCTNTTYCHQSHKEIQQHCDHERDHDRAKDCFFGSWTSSPSVARRA